MRLLQSHRRLQPTPIFIDGGADTHIAHRMAHAATNRALPDNMQLAYDGQRVTAGM
jgi:hypothetical protein